MIPAIFEYDHDGHATGTVAVFCSERCRQNWNLHNEFEISQPGLSETPDPQSQCWYCGSSLETKETHNAKENL